MKGTAILGLLLILVAAPPVWAAPDFAMMQVQTYDNPKPAPPISRDREAVTAPASSGGILHRPKSPQPGAKPVTAQRAVHEEPHQFAVGCSGLDCELPSGRRRARRFINHQFMTAGNRDFARHFSWRQLNGRQLRRIEAPVFWGARLKKSSTTGPGYP